MQEMKARCEEKIREAFEITSRKYGFEILEYSIQWSTRMTTTAGKAIINPTLPPSRRFKIVLSETLLRLNGDDFINRTPAHEAIHIVDYIVFGKIGHGRTWKMLMHLVGSSDKRCHQMKVAANGRRNKHVYVVKGKEIILGPIRHKRLQAGEQSYITRGVGKILPEHYTGKIL
jgi:predicted SprT family Zn-dependent metalloprotease